MPIVQMHASEQGVGSAVKELKADVPGYVSHHGVAAHPERIPGPVAAGVPTVDSRHRTCIRRDKRREREDAVAVFAAARCQGRNHGVAQPRQHALAFTAVIQSIFFEGF